MKQTLVITITADYDEDEARAISVEDGDDPDDVVSAEDMAQRIAEYIAYSQDVIGEGCDRYWFGGVSNARPGWRVE